jgi:cytochrome oxidase Cu insertion factor (SCO1/SenC/PrrC family)
MKCMVGIAFGFLVAAGAVLAADQPPEGKTGLAVGQKAPEFTLKDQRGQEQSLSVLRKDANVALVFYRSASW